LLFLANKRERERILSIQVRVS